MGSSISPTSPFLSTHNYRYCHFRPWNVTSSTPFPNFRFSRQRRVSFSASLVEKKLNLSWLTPDKDANNNYGGWEIQETQMEENNTKEEKGISRLFFIGARVSALVLIAGIGYIAGRSFISKSNAPSNDLWRLLTPSSSITSRDESSDLSTNDENFASHETPSGAIEEKAEIDPSGSIEKLPKRVIVTVAADSTQEEALQILKKLEIIDGDIKADGLCTRREYARWLVKANSLFERNPKHRIFMLPPGSVVQAFEDVNIEDPDFQFIQALAEVGIVQSKLSADNNLSDLDRPKLRELVNFYPESFLSRMDLINWKAQLEYPCMPRIEEISTQKVAFMDASTISPETSSEFFMDMLAGDKGILRKVFGQIKRFQPQKPVTKAQAAVALTSGRMIEAIHTELLRREAENSSMISEMEEIRSELLGRGDIQRFWEEKLNEVRDHRQEVESNFDATIGDLEFEQSMRDKSLSENLKEWAALDCQRKLLVNLKEEVNEMSERLTRERGDLTVEQKKLEDMVVDLQGKQDSIVEAKSVLEAEKEALQMLRSWVEEEARRSQARAKVLEQVARRWKWSEEA